jgi:hypothetical protein
MRGDDGEEAGQDRHRGAPAPQRRAGARITWANLIHCMLIQRWKDVRRIKYGIRVRFNSNYIILYIKALDQAGK